MGLLLFLSYLQCVLSTLDYYRILKYQPKCFQFFVMFFFLQNQVFKISFNFDFSLSLRNSFSLFCPPFANQKLPKNFWLKKKKNYKCYSKIIVKTVCDVELQFEKAMMNEVKNVKRARECEKKNENQPP